MQSANSGRLLELARSSWQPEPHPQQHRAWHPTRMATHTHDPGRDHRATRPAIRKPPTSARALALVAGRSARCFCPAHPGRARSTPPRDTRTQPARHTRPASLRRGRTTPPPYQKPTFGQARLLPNYLRSGIRNYMRTRRDHTPVRLRGAALVTDMPNIIRLAVFAQSARSDHFGPASPKTTASVALYWTISTGRRVNWSWGIRFICPTR